MAGVQKHFTSLGILWLRLFMGAGIAHHGYGKIFGGHMEGFTQGVAHLGFPAPELFAWLAALAEFGGGLLIMLGLWTQIAAFSVFSTMTVAAFLQHGSDPLSVKELALAYWTMAAMLVFSGSGKYGVDAVFHSGSETE